MRSSVSVLRATSLDTSAASESAATKMEMAEGMSFLTVAAPCTSMRSTTSLPAASAASTCAHGSCGRCDSVGMAPWRRPT
eukprot:355149-Chlamydomonas_euryale.AAC.2